MRLKKAALTAFVMISCLSFLQPPETKIYEEDLALRYGRQLTAVFGEDSRISPGETITGYFWNKDTDKPDWNKPYRYTRWELDYTDAYGCPAAFVFSNYAENITGAVRSHLKARVEAYYDENFLQPYIVPYVDEDSVSMYCSFYSLFSDRKRPETSIMFEERLQYETDILEHARLDEMRYETVFDEYPVTLSMYGYVRYGDLSAAERQEKVDFLEAQLNKMTDAMVRYTGGCLNGSVGITFLDGDGPDAVIGYQILKGEIYTGEDFEVDLHQAFFGPIDLDGS